VAPEDEKPSPEPAPVAFEPLLDCTFQSRQRALEIPGKRQRARFPVGEGRAVRAELLALDRHGEGGEFADPVQSARRGLQAGEIPQGVAGLGVRLAVHASRDLERCEKQRFGVVVAALVLVDAAQEEA
jgi:hypothetical protein